MPEPQPNKLARLPLALDLAERAVLAAFFGAMAWSFLRSWQGEATPERGGKAKRYFMVEGAGLLALDESERVRSAMRTGSGRFKPVGGVA